MAEAPPTGKHGSIASRLKIYAVIVIIVIMLSLTLFLPVQLNLTVLNRSGTYVLIIVDNALIGEYRINGTSLNISFSVSVGQHTVGFYYMEVPLHREHVMAWPFVGAEVTYTLSND